MERSHTVGLVIVSLILAVLAVFLFAGMSDGATKDLKVEIIPFNATPDTFGSGFYNNTAKMSHEELETIYRTQVIVHNESYSPKKHRAKHPNDQAVRKPWKNDERVVIILTNEDPNKPGYFVGK